MDIPDTFVAKVVRHNDVLRITIPTELCRFMGVAEGDDVKVLIKKVER